MGALSLPAHGVSCNHRCGLEVPQILCLVLGKGWDERRAGALCFTFSTGSLAPHGNSDRDQEEPHQHVLLTGTAVLLSTEKPIPKFIFNLSLRQKKRETFTALPAKFHQAGRNDPREQSRIIEMGFKPLVCSCGRSGCRCLCADIHSIQVVHTPLQSQSGLGGPGGDGAHPAVIYIVQSSSFLQGKKKQPSS